MGKAKYIQQYAEEMEQEIENLKKKNAELLTSFGKIQEYKQVSYPDSIEWDGYREVTESQYQSKRKQYGINPYELTWLEHYARDEQDIKWGIKETYDVVTFVWNTQENKFEHPDWKHIGKEEAFKLLGIHDLVEA